MMRWRAVAVLAGLAVDELYALFGMSAQAAIGHAQEAIPPWMALSGSILLVLLSVRPIWKMVKQRLPRFKSPAPESFLLPTDEKADNNTLPVNDCGPG